MFCNQILLRNRHILILLRESMLTVMKTSNFVFERSDRFEGSYGVLSKIKTDDFRGLIDLRGVMVF